MELPASPDEQVPVAGRQLANFTYRRGSSFGPRGNPGDSVADRPSKPAWRPLRCRKTVRTRTFFASGWIGGERNGRAKTFHKPRASLRANSCKLLFSEKNGRCRTGKLARSAKAVFPPVQNALPGAPAARWHCGIVQRNEKRVDETCAGTVPTARQRPPRSWAGKGGVNRYQSLART
jgi:hypothetical protein